MVALYDRPWTAKPGNNNTISRGQSSNHTHYDVINQTLLELLSWCIETCNSCLIDVFVVVVVDCLFVCLLLLGPTVPGYRRRRMRTTLPATSPPGNRSVVRAESGARVPPGNHRTSRRPDRSLWRERQASVYLADVTIT